MRSCIAPIALVLVLSLTVFGCGGGNGPAGTAAVPETQEQPVAEAPAPQDPQTPETPGAPEDQGPGGAGQQPPQPETPEDPDPPVGHDPAPQPPETPGSPDPPVPAPPAQQSPQQPAAPQGLMAVPEIERVRLSWQATAGATGYRVYWNETGGVTTNDRFEPVAGMPQFEHTGLTAGVEYAYRVAAVNEAGEGPLSAEVAAVPAAPAVDERVRSDSAP